MRIRLPTALLAYGLEGPSASSTVDNLHPQAIHLRNPKTCPNKPSHFFVSLRALMPTGSIVSDRLRQRVLETLTPNLYVRYGTNETGSIALATPQDVHAISGTVGRPLSGVQVEVVAADGMSLPTGDIGQIRIRSPGMIDHYLDDDDATKRAFRDGWFLPGDLGKFTPDGQLIFLGRADQMMIMDGINIYPDLS